MQNMAYRSAKTAWEMKKRLQSLRQHMHSWNNYMTTKEAFFPVTKNNSPARKVIGLHRLLGLVHHAEQCQLCCDCCSVSEAQSALSHCGHNMKWELSAHKGNSLDKTVYCVQATASDLGPGSEHAN